MHAHYTHTNTGKKKILHLQRYIKIDSSTCTVQWNLTASSYLKLLSLVLGSLATQKMMLFIQDSAQIIRKKTVISHFWL